MESNKKTELIDYQYGLTGLEKVIVNLEEKM